MQVAIFCCDSQLLCEVFLEFAQRCFRLWLSHALLCQAVRAHPHGFMGCSFGDNPFQRSGEFLEVNGGPSVQVEMRQLTPADYFMATLAVGIVIGYPVWYWISEIFLRHSSLP